MKHGQAAVDLAKTRFKKNQYTQSSRRVNVFSGYSDCSSLVWKCYEKANGIYVGSWTGEQVGRGRRILLCQNRYAYGKLTPAEVTKMQVGDCIFYGGGSATHVEMYLGNGQQIGHGSGMGPTIKNCLEYAHPSGVYQIRRYVADDTTITKPNSPKKWKATGTAISTGDQVNMRQSPNGKILRTVDKGNRFEVDGYVVSGWAHVRVEDTIGYIHEDYVKVDNIPKDPAENRLFVARTKAEVLNVRSWYGRDEFGHYFPRIPSYPELKEGNLMDVLVSYKYGREVWYKVRIARKHIGYVMGDFIERQ